MILEIALGDAYGAAFEWAPIEFVEQHNDGIHYATRTSKHGNMMGGGNYSDDTQMTFAVAEVVLSNPPYFKPEMFAAGFLTAFKRDVPYRKGYGSRVRLALTNSFSAWEFISSVSEPHSSSNGSVMRVLPCGILSTPEMVQNAAISQSIATHLHYDAIDAARILALLTHSLIYREEIEFPMHVAWAIKECGFRPDHKILYPGEYSSVPCDAMITVSAALNVIGKSKSYKDVLINSVNKLGDVDSVAAIAMGLASLCPHIKKEFDSNSNLFVQLENGQFGRDYCIQLDQSIKMYIEKNKVAMSIKKEATI